MWIRETAAWREMQQLHQVPQRLIDREPCGESRMIEECRICFSEPLRDSVQPCSCRCGDARRTLIELGFARKAQQRVQLHISRSGPGTLEIEYCREPTIYPEQIREM